MHEQSLIYFTGTEYTSKEKQKKNVKFSKSQNQNEINYNWQKIKIVFKALDISGAPVTELFFNK